MSAIPPGQQPPHYPQPPQRKRGGLTAGVIGGSLAALLLGGTVLAMEAGLVWQATTTATALAHPPVAQPQTGGTTNTSALNVTPATDDQKVGVVTIDTDLYYGQGAAAGTGSILTSDGTILTNNHVIEGSTSITVTVESTGKTYTADLVGTDPTADIAVLKLEGASGLSTVDISHTAAKVGDDVTSIGNAEGTGDLVAAEGPVSATAETITVNDELTGKPKDLKDLIEVSADVVSGDSGGPLLDTKGDVVGVVTAASSGTQHVTGYAIPIETAMSVADQILAGKSSDEISLGLPAFLGVTVSQSDTGAGAVIGSTIVGLPAEQAGLIAGQTITSIDGTPVADYDALSTIIEGYQPGDTVQVGITGEDGTASVVQVTLVGGPAK